MYKVLFTVTVLLILNSCGGGGGDGGNTNDTPNDAPVNTPVITSFTVDATTILAGSTVNLTAVFANGTGKIDNGVGNITTGVPVTFKPDNSTTLTLTVTNSAGATVAATVNITVNAGALGLNSLSVVGAALDQIFQPNQPDYTATVGFVTSAITVKATTDAAGATITVNGVAIGADNTSQSIALVEGINPVINIVVTAANSTTKIYALTITRQFAAAFAQQAYIKASNTDANDAFGFSVALSDDTLVVGANNESSAALGINADQADNTAAGAGAVYVFIRSGISWVQQAYLKASNTDKGDKFGRSVALSGDTLVVGAPTEDSGATGVNGDQGNTDIDAGAVYVFVRVNSIWTQQAYLKASYFEIGDRDLFGWSVTLSGDTIAVGAIGEDSYATGVNGDATVRGKLRSGAVYVFTRSGTMWLQQAYIKASNSDTGDGFGGSVALSGDTLAVGVPGEASAASGVNADQTDDSAIGTGAVYVFTRNITTWSQQAYIKASNAESQDQFGTSLALSGDTLVVGAPREDSNATGVNGDQTDDTGNGIQSGAVYVFTRDGTTWSQQAYLKRALNAPLVRLFGRRIALYEDTLAIGTGGRGDFEAPNNSGAVYVFSRNDDIWSQQAYLKAANADAEDLIGFNSIGLFGGTVAIGAYLEDSAANGVNGDQTDNSAPQAGAVYVFE